VLLHFVFWDSEVGSEGLRFNTAKTARLRGTMDPTVEDDLGRSGGFGPPVIIPGSSDANRYGHCGMPYKGPGSAAFGLPTA
jgi:hypothetical protein